MANPFCGAAGMDLNELVQISTAAAHQRAFLKDLTDAFANFSKPIIAAVVGFAVSCGVWKWEPPPNICAFLFLCCLACLTETRLT